MSSGTINSTNLAMLASPLNDQQFSQLQQTVSQLSSAQLAWVSGYLWGLHQSQDMSLNEHHEALSETVQPAHRLTVIYGSQTGHAKGVAKSFERDALTAGIPVRVLNADNYKPKELTKETHVIVVSSTNGDGEAPDNIRVLHEFLQSKKAPRLSGLKFGVLGLGDSSYEFFCQTAKDFDFFLTQLGATPLIERLDCDVDYEAAAAEWRQQALVLVKRSMESELDEAIPTPHHANTSVVELYSKNNPFEATLLTNQKITGRDSEKDVRHIEIDLNHSGIHYHPGDALGVWYENSLELVEAILSAVGLRGDELVMVDGETFSVRDALMTRFEITAANPPLVAKLAELTNSETLSLLIKDKDALRHYAANTQLIDVFTSVSITLTAEQLLGLLRRLTPRLYSIASSQLEVEDEVHLTVGVVAYEHEGQSRLGGASGYLSHRLEEGDSVKVFIESNPHFKLPQDDTRPIIMVGPGTGIAPFRSFIQEREQRHAEGKNWLFFGGRTFTQDFLYQVEWQKYLQSGVLTRLDVAFSRDQNEKIYVQDRLLEQAEQVWRWIEDGAYFYVCGDASCMAKDVHDALITIVEQQGKMNHEQAEQYIDDLRKAKRYQKDVY